MSIILSIIVPVFNTPISLLEKALYPFMKYEDPRVELIVVDDGSNARTAKFLDDVEFKVSSKVIHQSNKGQNSARDTGIEKSSGQYIGFLDSDDSISFNVLKQMLNDYKIWNYNIIVFKAKMYNEKSQLYSNINRSISRSKRDYLSNCSELWSQFFKKESFISNGGLLLTNGSSIGEDLASLIPIVIRTNSIIYTNYCLYSYFKHSGSIIHSLNINKHMTILDSFDYILSTVSSSELKEYYHEIEWQAINHILNYEVRFQLSSGFKGIYNAKQLFKWVNHNFPEWRQNHYYKSRYNGEDFRFKLAVNHHFLSIVFLQFLKNFIER